MQMGKYLIYTALWLFPTTLMAQTIPNQNTFPNGVAPETPEVINYYETLPSLELTPQSLQKSLPTLVDNSTQIYFRPLVDQSTYNSCVHAATVVYTYTYEVNRIRNLPANSLVYFENHYPAHYTYNYVNGGENGFSGMLDGWRIIQDCGIPTLPEWGDIFGDAIKWMTGYDKYLSALQNRVIMDIQQPFSVASPEGLFKLKH